MKAFLFFLLLTSLSVQAQKKTICSMTLNSQDEINVFKSTLSAEEFDFIELTQFNTDSEKHWLSNSCQAGVECDVLVISGHFAGTFFGSSGKSLNLLDLEKTACSNECSGIFKKTKEVYLFGCNTLAGKEKDSRTPEEYLRVLLNDGFSLGHAQQVVAFRYSPIGGSFANRMRSVFNYTPQIYGFNSVSPLGKKVAPMLSKYLQKKAAGYSAHLQNNSPQANKQLLAFFKGTSLVQASGMSFTLDPQGKLQQSPVCFLNSPNKITPRIEKLKWIQGLFAKGNGLELLMHVSDFLHQEKNNKKWNSDELIIFNSIKENTTLKEELFNLLESPAPWLDRAKLDILNFVSEMNWLDKDSINEKVYGILKLKSPTFSVEDMQRVCGYGITYPIGIYDFNVNSWSNNYFKYAIMCITPATSYALWNKINESTYGQ